MRELSPLFGMGTLELATHYHVTPLEGLALFSHDSEQDTHVD